MDKCGHCAYWANNSFTGTSSCRLTKRDDVGYFAPSCEHFEKREQPTKPKETMETTETKIEEVLIENAKKPGIVFKTCKICRCTLPLDSFPKHPRTKDGHTTICADCFRAKNAASIQKAVDARVNKTKAAVEPETTKEAQRIGAGIAENIKDQLDKRPILPPFEQLASLTDRQLFDELRRRGWTGTLTRTETLE